MSVPNAAARIVGRSRCSSTPLRCSSCFGRLQTAKAFEIEDKTYALSHGWGASPIHLISFRYDLDTTSHGVFRTSPHSLVQELLNRSDDHLWAFVSNGLQLRILRDNVSFTRPAFVEFDLEAMMEGEVYSDFLLLWLLCHQSRVESDIPEQCWLEKWHQTAKKQGTRVLDRLRDGVQKSIEAFGKGFLDHRGNTALRQKLADGKLSTQDYYQQLLRLVYRLIFLFVAEDRDLLLVREQGAGNRDQGSGARGQGPGNSDDTQLLTPDPCALTPTRPPNPQSLTPDLYNKHYSLDRIRRLSQRRRGTRHSDLWQGVKVVFKLLYKGEPRLGLPALGSMLFSDRTMPDLDGCELANDRMLEAVRHLAFTVERNVLRQVDYKNLGSEELGSVYESLLELHPDVNTDAATFELTAVAGSERKTTGSYYTPSSLINCLLDSALDPVIEDALKRAREQRKGAREQGSGARGQGAGSGPQQRSATPDPYLPPDPCTPTPEEKALLSLKVCDPACGSGHFLIAAANRLSHHLATVRTGDEEPSPAARRVAFRDCVSHCIYGVDINPMAVELCKVALWLESIDPGKPLSFLDHRILCGNSLIGVTPRLLAEGIPDDAFKPITGDDKAVVSEYKRRNKDEKKGQLQLDFGAMPSIKLGNLVQTFANLAAMDDGSLQDVEAKEKKYAEFVDSTGYQSARLLADAWCAAFVWKKDKFTGDCITESWFRRIEANPHCLPPWMREKIDRLRDQYQFFHWHLAFPDAFRVPSDDDSPENDQTGWSGGFDCVLGNPPWDRIKLQEKEWFASRRSEIANAPNAAKRRKMIRELAQEAPQVLAAFEDARREAEGQSHLVRDSGNYPLCGRGDVNTYSIFSELDRSILAPSGRLGCIVPSGIATDDTTKFFFQDITQNASLSSLFIFENERRLFPGIDHRNKFALMTVSGTGVRVPSVDIVFGAYEVSDLATEERHFSLTADEIALLNPNTRTCPIFRSRRDAELTKGVYRRLPVLLNETSVRDRDTNPWRVRFATMFHMANDSGLFRTRQELERDGFCLKRNTFENHETVFLPLYEAKMFWHFDHRFGTYEGQTLAQARQNKLPELGECEHSQSGCLSLPKYWVESSKVTTFYKHNNLEAPLLLFRDVTNAVVLRTAVFCLAPQVAVGHKAPLLVSETDEVQRCALLACLNSFVFDYLTRQSIGGVSLSFFILKQLPVVRPDDVAQVLPGWRLRTWADWIKDSVLELCFSAWDLVAVAQSLGYDGPPFRWDEDRRFLIRCELDAAYFHLYGIERDDVDYIMETFPIVKRKDIARTEVKDGSGEVIQEGRYITKDTILEIYDEMAAAMRQGSGAREQVAGNREVGSREVESAGGKSDARSDAGAASSPNPYSPIPNPSPRVYQTRLDPPPGPPADAEGNFLPLPEWLPGQPRPADWPRHIHAPREVYDWAKANNIDWRTLLESNGIAGALETTADRVEEGKV